MEGDASDYQVNLVNRMTGEGRAEFRRTRGPGFDQKGSGGEGGGEWGVYYYLFFVGCAKMSIED